MNDFTDKVCAAINLKIPRKPTLNEIALEGVAHLAKKLQQNGMSTQNCMIVIRSNGEFFVAASGISAMDLDCAIEDFARMILASFNSDKEAIDFLSKMVTRISNHEIKAGNLL